ncbi:MAG: glycosyltransferase, partial [Candidatus Staskawiczbacteria bacterium]|nr:glycosyltransferase [Candidatus Staskawiczbacteria bacterium]
MEKKYPLGHKKVLILYAPLGAGHGAAAKAVEEAFALKYPNIEVKNVNILDYTVKSFRFGLPWAFSYFNSKAPFVYKWVYRFYNNQTNHKNANRISGIVLKKKKFVKFIEEFNPNFIISANPLPRQLVLEAGGKKITDIPSANICTDFGFHSLWYDNKVKYYFVATESVKNALMNNHNVAGEKIMVTGIPICSKFNKKLDREKIIKDLGFDASKPILLIVGGKISYNNLIKIIKGIKRSGKIVQLIVVAGRDKVLEKKISSSDLKNDKAIRTFGFVDNLEEYMTIADLILTKAGGLTVSECLVENLLMIFNNVIPIQEDDNVEYSEKNGVGVKVNNVKET